MSCSTKQQSAAGWVGGRRRAGFTALELMISATVLAAVASLTMLTAARLQSGRARLTQRTLARQLLANTAERVDAVEFNQLSAETAAAFAIPTEFSSHLPNAQLTIEVDPLQFDGLSVKRVVIRASYTSAGVPRNARLVFWRFAPGEENR